MRSMAGVGFFCAAELVGASIPFMSIASKKDVAGRYGFGFAAALAGSLIWADGVPVTRIRGAAGSAACFSPVLSALGNCSGSSRSGDLPFADGVGLSSLALRAATSERRSITSLVRSADAEDVLLAASSLSFASIALAKLFCMLSVATSTRSVPARTRSSANWLKIMWISSGEELTIPLSG